MKLRFILLALAALLTAGCGQSAGTPSSAPPVAPAGAPHSASAPAASASASSSANAAATSARGNLIKNVGQPASLTNNGTTIATFVIKSIEVDAKCSSRFAQTPKGHIVVISVDAETTPDLAKDTMKTWSLNMFGWKAISNNGTTVNGSAVALGCIDSTEAFPSGMGPAEKATGKIAFDVPSVAGTLIYTEPGASAGWEWSYPAR